MGPFEMERKRKTPYQKHFVGFRRSRSRDCNFSKKKSSDFQRFSGSDGKLAVIGCSEILSNQFLKKYSSNQLLGQNLINWLKGSEELLDIPPKSVNEFNILMTKSEFEQWLYSLSIVPASIALLGIFVGWLRKEL